MAIVLAVFAVLVLYDLPRFIRGKERARVYVIYAFLMAASLAVSLLLSAGQRLASPAEWIGEMLKMTGAVK